jgi:hypothetical protein
VLVERGERGTLQQPAGKPRFTTVQLSPASAVTTDVDSLLASVERSLADLGW